MDNTFRESIDLNSSGDKLVVAGSTYISVYENINNSWQIVGSPITVSTTEQSIRMSVAINGNGKIVVVGMPSESKVKVFEYKHSAWSQLGEDISIWYYGMKLLGYSVDISEDGLTIVASNPGNIEKHLNVKTGNYEKIGIENIRGIGVAYLLKFDSESDAWTYNQETHIVHPSASSKTNQYNDYEFGKKIKLSKDLSTILISSRDKTYIYYERSGRISRWAKAEKEIPGVSCDLNENGSRILSNNGDFLELYSYEKNQDPGNVIDVPDGCNRS